ncbi:MAG: insulinase family protein [Lachnospiraceae bacterium]|nr:insulinase family protein [Lachnospiraceae bacterium]
MNLEKLTAYEVLEQRPVSDLNSEGAILRHKKTGARVCLLSNDDENKVFYIGFRTPPEDSTGVAHINEHSVLCGSEKYPVKDPFVELAKGSLNTFLNAMTYPDKTIYPIASCNDKDFANLMDVYLDAVFHPNIYKEKKIFEQEGWHYELDEDGNLIYNGVVYNEMKGAYSSADDVLEREIMNELFPATAYGVDSGGKPENIPDLTYEQFLDFHRRYYHPSNSYIYLYGNMDMAERLDYIDREYLRAYDALFVDSKVERQPLFSETKRVTKQYPVLESDERDNLYYFSYNVLSAKMLDPEFYIALDVLDYALCSSPGAPVKVALQAAGIGEDDYSVSEAGILQPYFSFISKNAKKEDGERFVTIIEDTLRELAENGIERDALMAAINLFAFKYKEADFGSYPKGLMYGLQALDSWLYDDMAPFMYIEANETFQKLRQKVEEGYFEQMIRDLFLNNPHKVILTLEPSRTLAEEMDQALAKRLSEYQKSLSPEQLENIEKNADALKAYQATENTPQELATIPMLGRADLKKEAKEFRNSKHTLTLPGGRSFDLWQHDYFTNGVTYYRILFDVTHLSDEDLFDLGLLKTIIGLVNTEHYSYGKFNNLINLKTGGITTPVSSVANANDREQIRVFFEVKARSFVENTKDAIELAKEMLLYSDFSDTDRIREILLETKASMQASFQSAGHNTAVGRAMSKLSKGGWISEQLSGIDFLDRLTDLLAGYDTEKEGLPKRLDTILRKVLSTDTILLDVTGKDDIRKSFEQAVPSLLQELPADVTERDPAQGIGASFAKDESIRGALKEGLVNSSDVCYVCRAGDFTAGGLPYTGALKVLKVMMGYDYLWVNVRVQGGAYGCMSAFMRPGYSYFVSYRDPNLEKTIDVFENAPAYISQVNIDEESLTKYIIGAIATLDMPLTPQAAGARSLSSVVAEYSFEKEQKERDEIIGCSVEDIHALSAYLQAVLQSPVLVVDGKEDKIRAAKDCFDAIRAMNR